MPKVAKVRDVVLISAALGVLLLTLGMYAYFGFGALGVIAVDSTDHRVDFGTFWRLAQALWNGGDIYDVGGKVSNLNPPFWTILISPLGLLNELAATGYSLWP